MTPHVVGKIEVRNLDAFNRPQYESSTRGHDERREHLSRRIQHGRAQAIGIAFSAPPGKFPERLIARPPNRGDTLKLGPILVAVATKLSVKTMGVDYVRSLRLKVFGRK